METGAKWKGWRVDQLIGEGSYGKVYKLVREEYGHVYNSALKVIPIPQSKAEEIAVKEELDSEKSVRSYYQSMIRTITEEITMMSQLRGNSNIVSYEDHSVEERVDRFGWDICIRMELLTPLRQYRETRDLTVYDIVRMGIDICRGLETCEKYSIIHRDIKPANIFYSEQGFFKLGDFGIARQMEREAFEMSKKGTVSFMAPEVYRGDSYDLTADIYSLGLVLYQYLNRNRAPFLPPYPEDVYFSDRETANEQRLSGATLPRPLFASAALTEILRKACAFSPAHRYQSAADFRKALEQVLSNDMKQQVALPADREEESASDELAKTVLDESVINTMDSTALPSKKKRPLIMILAVILAFSLLGGTLCFKQSYERKGWKAAYEKVLKKNEDSIRAYESLDEKYRPTNHSVALCDINKDEIPELLFVSYNEEYWEKMFSIYSYQNRSAKRLFFEEINDCVYTDSAFLPDEETFGPVDDSNSLHLCLGPKDGMITFISFGQTFGGVNQFILANNGRLKRSNSFGITENSNDKKESRPVFFKGEKKVSEDTFSKSCFETFQNLGKTIFSPQQYSPCKGLPKEANEKMSQAASNDDSMSVDEALNKLNPNKYSDLDQYTIVLNDYYSFISEYEEYGFSLKQAKKEISKGIYPYVSKRFAEALCYYHDGERHNIQLTYALCDINNDGTQELIVRWGEIYYASSVIYGFIQREKPKLITDDCVTGILDDGIVLEKGEDLWENRTIIIYHISEDDLSLIPQDSFRQKDKMNSEGDVISTTYYHGDEKISEKEYDELYNKLIFYKEKDLHWTVLRKKTAPEWSN